MYFEFAMLLKHIVHFIVQYFKVSAKEIGKMKNKVFLLIPDILLACVI